MAVTFTIEMGKGDATRKQLDAVRALTGATSEATMPPGMLVHLESETPSGYRIVDVWESEEDFQAFFESALGAAFDKAGFHPLAGPPAIESVVNLLGGRRTSDAERSVRALVDAFCRNDPTIFERCVHPDFVEHQEWPGIPPTRAGLAQIVAYLHSAFGGFRMEALDIVSGPGRAACRFRATGTHTGEFMGVPASGRPIEVEGIDYFAIDDDGLVREHWGAFDQAGLMAQLGVPAQAGPPSIELPTEART